MSDERTLFKPDGEEPDPKSKVSYLEHISYRLKLPVPLKCESEKGLLSTLELRELANEIVFFVDGAILDEESAGSYQIGLKTHYDKSDDDKFKFLHARDWNDFSKPQLAQVISLLLRFQLITKEEVAEDDNQGFHIGESNGAIYLPFYKEIYDRLPNPSNEEFELTKQSISERELIRTSEVKKISELIEMHKDPSKDGTMVPEFQRDNTQWARGNRQLMIDSIMHNIPMPALVLGKSEDRPEDPWQIIDGHQRLTTMLFFVDAENNGYFPLFSGEYYHTLPTWARKRFDDYKFTVEKVIAKSDHHLSSLYERYNDSGKKMTQPQIRVALFHEISALHHYLLSMAGGPMLAKRPKARIRLGIHDNIDYRANRASALRSLLPTTSKPRPDERLQLRKVTERIYDLWCRIVGYCNYRKLEGNRTEFPTAKEAINTVFHHFRHGSTANEIGERLDYIIRECATLYGDYAFCSMKAFVDPEDSEKTTWEIRKSTHGWAAQVQCAGIWNLSDVDLSLLAHNPDRFQSEWADFCKDEIAQQRQNSKSIWAAQEKWQKKVSEIISSINSQHLEEEDSPKRKQLVAAVELALSLGADGRKAVMSMWKLEKSPEEYEFLMKELDEMS
jgi:hypothetical protein